MSGNTEGQAGRAPLPVVQIHAIPAGMDPADVATAEIRMAIGGYPVRLDLAVPAVPTRLRDLLPVFQGMANVEVDVAVRTVEQQGLTISCCKGCGACCRQPVPITETEARALVQLVDRMPEPRRSQVRARFADARQRLAAAGMLDRIRRTDEITGLTAPDLAVDYFHLGIACPFLEDESCSIHPDRPLACREFLVTSPAEYCARPEVEDKVQRVPLRGEIFRAVRGVDGRSSDSAGCTLLVMAPEWVAEHPDEPPPKPGPAWLQDFFSQLAHRDDREVEFVPAAGWVIADNLLPFLTAVGWVVGHGFGPGDWEKVSGALPQTDAAADRWHVHAVAGGHRARVRLARDPEGVVQVRLEVPREAEAQVKLAIAIFQRFHVQ
jgi:Fe-S-cluster containining protein